MKSHHVCLLLVCAALAVAGARAQGVNVDMMPCNASSPHQQWAINPTGLDHIILLGNGHCIDVDGYGVSDGSNIWTYTCHPEDKNPAHQNQAWTFNKDGTITENMSGKCMAVSGLSNRTGANVWLWKCTGAANQQWTYDKTTKQIKGVMSGLCLDSGTPVPPPPPPCSVEPAKSKPFCDTSLSFEERVANLVSLIPDEDKANLFANSAAAVTSLGINAYQWWSEALHGVAFSPGVHFGGQIPAATSFPQAILSASSFNASLFMAIATTISTEARAMSNDDRAGLTFWAPNINIFRDPRWGRGQETPGEDPWLTSVYVKNFVQGMQGGKSEHYLKVSSCCKHYDAYSLEDWHGMDRYHFDAIVTPQDFNDTYLPAWEACVRDGNASAIMCSYNAENGVPSCANKWLMNELARDTWGFDGYITSDCGAVAAVINDHHYTSTPEETVAVTLQAGMDIDCGSYVPDNLQAALTSGAVTMADVDLALSHQFMVQFRLGMFDPDDMQPYKKLGPQYVNTKEHQALALDAARQGIVLLKNDNGNLPLSATTAKTVAVIGPNGNATTTMQGNYYGQAPYLISPMQGVQSYTSASFTFGCGIASNDTSGFAAATAAAAAADAVVMVMGLDQTQEREGHDRDIVSLPGVQAQLIEQVAAAAKSPITVVLMCGGPVDMTAANANPKVGSILWVGYPGQSGGQAMGDVIFGAVNPAGRLPVTWVKSSFVHVSLENMNMRPNASADYPGRTYRFFTGPPVYKFGQGMSYTSWAFAWAAPPSPAQQTASTAATTMSVKVSNTGSRDGDQAVLVYAVPPGAGVNGAPLKYLVAFDRVSVAAGASTTVSFTVPADKLLLTDAEGKKVYTTGKWTFFVDTASTLSGSVTLQ